MGTKQTVDFHVDKENKKINFERSFNGSVENVWNAWTNPELLDQWWAPKPWKAKTKEMDFRVGGHWLYAMVGPEGEEHWARADYKSINPKEFFSGDDSFCDKDGVINEDFGTTNWNVKFSGSGDSTHVSVEMRFKELKNLEQQVEMGFKEGMSMAMENLDELLEKK